MCSPRSTSIPPRIEVLLWVCGIACDSRYIINPNCHSFFRGLYYNHHNPLLLVVGMYPEALSATEHTVGLVDVQGCAGRVG